MLCPQEEAEKVQFLLDKVNTKYDEVKADIRNRLVVATSCTLWALQNDAGQQW